MSLLYWEQKREHLKKELSKWLVDKYIENHFDENFMDEDWKFPDGDIITWTSEILLDIYYDEDDVIEFMLKLVQNDITIGDIMPLAEKLVDEELKRIEEEEE